MARFVPFHRRNRDGNSPFGPYLSVPGEGWSRESIVNEFLIVRPLACFVTIERETGVCSKGDVSSQVSMTVWQYALRRIRAAGDWE